MIINDLILFRGRMDFKILLDCKNPYITDNHNELLPAKRRLRRGENYEIEKYNSGRYNPDRAGLYHRHGWRLREWHG